MKKVSMDTSPFTAVAGLVVAAVTNNPERDHVNLRCFGGTDVHITLDSDCCSESYFDEDAIADMCGLVGHMLISMAEVETRAPVFGCRQDEQAVHCLTITTARGSGSYLWRNDSNGYYDGKLVVYTVSL